MSDVGYAVSEVENVDWNKNRASILTFFVEK